jgi:hypothetical protein
MTEETTEEINEETTEPLSSYRLRGAKPGACEDLFRIGVDVLADDNFGQMIAGVHYEVEVDRYWQWGKERYASMCPEVEAEADPPYRGRRCTAS